MKGDYWVDTVDVAELEDRQETVGYETAVAARIRSLEADSRDVLVGRNRTAELAAAMQIVGRVLDAVGRVLEAVLVLYSPVVARSV